MDLSRLEVHYDEHGFSDSIDIDGDVILHLRPGTVRNGENLEEFVCEIRRIAQLEAVAEAAEADNLRLREALTMTKRLFCEAHLKVCQLHKVAEAASIDGHGTGGDCEGRRSAGLRPHPCRICDSLAAMREGDPNG